MDALPAASIAGSLALLHLWRVVLLCVTLTHEREHPALALLILVPLNHFLYNLTASLDPTVRQAAHWKKVPGVATGGSLPSAWHARAGLAAGFHLLASIAVVWWYGSLDALIADAKAFSRTWEWWVLVLTLIAFNVLYRPLVRALGRLVGATGLLDSRLWSALFLAIAVWIWCDGVFAALYQQLSLYCDGSAVEWCLSTTGYGDIVPLSTVARAMVAVEVLVGFGLLGFLLSRVAGFVSPSDAGPKRDTGV